MSVSDNNDGKDENIWTCWPPGNERVSREVSGQAAAVTLRSAKLSIKRGVVDGPAQHDRLRLVYQRPM